MNLDNNADNFHFLPLLAPDNNQGRIIHVTHQIPYQVSHDIKEDKRLHWSFTSRHGHAAMYAGMHSLIDEWETLCIGWTGKMYEKSTSSCQDVNLLEIDESVLSTDEKIAMTTQLQQEHNCIPLFLDSESVAGHYYGYCKTLLWPLFNYIIWNDATDGRIEKTQWNLYEAVNQKYADMVVEQYQTGDTIWIHDYHLLLVPNMVRNKLPKARIGLFVHSPFPSSEVFRCLPKRQEILKGMLGANLVGFQTYANARHFISTSTRVLGYESSPEGVENDGHFCHVGTFPIGIDVETADSARKSHEVVPKIKAITEMYAGKKILVGRDKIDLVQGVLQKLAAFEKFLLDYPEWQNKVVLIQVTDANATDSLKNEHKVSEMVAHINGNIGSLEWSPVYHYHHQIQTDDYYALLSTADAALITAVRDGMNTTCSEYVMCQQEKHGSLIVSELTGTAGSMGSALLVNPWDYSSVAKAINDALLMSEEEKLARHTGTLTPIQKTPMAAVPPNDMLQYLAALCRDPQNEVWIISGRDENALNNWLGHIDNLGMSAEHGSFIRYPHTKKWVNLTEHLDMSWKNDVLEIFTYYTERTTGSFIEHKRCALTWHYRLADPEYGAFQAKECQNHLEQAILSKLPVEVLVGKKNLEVRPTCVNKGEILKRLLASSSRPFDFVMCCGDDRTDEDMFKTLKKCDLLEQQKFAVLVGSEDQKTQANWLLPNVQQVIESMRIMADGL
ncbi:hypothetical protein [Parasitella parasitica]|uniref:Uncharacterized protein n=1 Tax=Parasitella parasitica TaxID=35722 RepID=A0A0B7N9R9_9FUNG|nr:hypothetical protein [Parasitella parasitica]